MPPVLSGANDGIIDDMTAPAPAASAPPSTSDLVKAAMNAHGAFFKKAIRKLIANLDPVLSVAEEYPVHYMDGGSIDLLAEIDSNAGLIYAAIECKKIRAETKQWIFFPDDDEKDIKMYYRIQGAGMSAVVADPAFWKGSCNDGLEVDQEKFRGIKEAYKAGSATIIHDAANQACKGGRGFLKGEIEARKKSVRDEQPVDMIVVFVIITTAPLFVIKDPVDPVDIATGEYGAKVELEERKWILYNVPFTPSSHHGADLSVSYPYYTDPLRRGEASREAVFIVNALHVKRFFEKLADPKRSFSEPG